MIGKTIGPYEVVAKLGAGGMGEVYRARDNKLNRDVALKVLPEAFASDPDRLARFRREAQVLASLNHPHIAQIYGIEDSGPTTAIVMELVEGVTLAEMMRVGTSAGSKAPALHPDRAPALDATHSNGGHGLQPLAISDALAIACQIADALEAAHEQGIIHRDLKPANVKVRDDGTVKLLDFGLAKALDASAASATADITNSPTLTARATEVGVILGTAAYMAPEQARGRLVDRRADIWAFGVVLYEMLSGRRAFGGEDVSITLANVLKEDVRWESLPSDLPAPIRRLLRRCLEKDPKRRLSWIGEGRLMLEDPAAFEASAAPGSTAPLWRRRALLWGVAGLCGVPIAAAIVLWSPWRAAPSPSPAPRKLLASIGVDASIPIGAIGAGASAILSPDGTTLAFVARAAGRTESVLYVRKLDQLRAEALAGTEGAGNPFFSPDGQWIAFFAAGQLKKVQVTGGAPVRLCVAPDNRGGTWTDDDEIIFVPSPLAPLARVSASGGTPAVFGSAGEEARNQRWPQALPDRRGVLYTELIISMSSDYDRANVMIAPLSGGAPKVVLQGGYFPRYVAGAPGSPAGPDPTRGHLLYVSEGRVWARAFDLDWLEPIGPAVPALDGVAFTAIGGTAQLALSPDGTLVYVPGGSDLQASAIDWLTADGKTSTLRPAKAQWGNPRFSPDGRSLAMDVFDGKQYDIWLYSLERSTFTQLTFDPADDRTPVWTPDGLRLVFASDRAERGLRNLYWVNANGSGEAKRLTDSPYSQVPASWHPSSKYLAFSAVRGSIDAMILPVDVDDARGLTAGTPTPFLDSPALEAVPMFSPDGRWIAYVALERAGASYDVWVQPFPPSGGKWKVSDGGGTYPRWSPTANELLFVNPWDPVLPKVMTSPYAVVDGSFRAEPARAWSPTGIRGVGSLNAGYDLHRDGKRVVAAAVAEQVDDVRDHLVFVFGFADYLSEIAPGSR